MEVSSMTHIEPGVSGHQGAKRQSWRAVDPRKLLREIIENDPNGGETAWRKAFWNIIKKELGGADLDGTYTQACVRYALDNAMNALAPDAAMGRTAKRTATGKAVERAKTKAQAILLLHLIMPNGKPLGQCTGADCKSFGGWYIKLAELVPAKKMVAD